jgi:hypothetical protein
MRGFRAVNCVDELKKLGVDPSLTPAARIRALTAAGQLECAARQSELGGVVGKRARAAAAATTAGRGSGWGNDLDPPPPKGKH